MKLVLDLKTKFEWLRTWLHGEVHMLHAKFGIRQIKNILKAHEKQLEEYKHKRAYWGQRVMMKHGLIKEYQKCLKVLREETCLKN